MSHALTPLAALLALLISSPFAGAGGPTQIESLLKQPLIRLSLLHTREGSVLLETLLGKKPVAESFEERLEKLVRVLREPRMRGISDELVPRLERVESESRVLLTESAAPGDFLSEVSRISAEKLAIQSVSSDSELAFAHGLAFSDYDSLRARFIEGFPAGAGPGADLSGLDLTSRSHRGADFRFARFQGAKVGDLSGADLRGADLRGALLLPESRFQGALYDQFTALPFGREEARSHGLIYKPSSPPEGFYAVDLERSIRAAAKAGQRPPSDPDRIALNALKSLLRVSPQSTQGVSLYPTPRHVMPQGREFVRFEAGKINESRTAAGREVATEIEGYGGELRRLISVDPLTGGVLAQKAAYFRLEGSMPVIAVTPDTEPSTLFHEREHLRDWMRLYRGFMTEGSTAEEALERASEVRATAAYKTFTETNAVRAGLNAEALAEDAIGTPLVERRGRFENRNFATTISYPEREGLRRIFKGRTLSKVRAKSGLWTDAERFCRRMIRNGLVARRGAFKTLGLRSAAEITREELFYDLIGGNRSRYTADGSLADIQALFYELLPSEVEKLPDDEFRRALRLLPPGGI
jgi:hypothetical protein